MLKALALGVSLSLLASLSMAQDTAEGPAKFEAVLKANAQLPAQTFLPAPMDAPAGLQMSGRFTSGTRVETPYGWANPASGIAMPFPGQPLQGMSGVRSLGEDRFLFLTDNGFGNKANSSDAMLMFNILKMDWEAGKVGIEKTIFLKDPNRVVPFPIVTEHSESRYLTGADFDPESIQPVGDNYWIGDEFGPWLIEVDAEGVVLQVVKTNPGGVDYKSPDNQFTSQPAAGAVVTGINTGRSGGYEGMAQSMDGITLYPLLEKPFFDEASGALETIGDKTVLRVLEFNVADATWSDTVRYYPLEDAGNAIGDFNIFEGTRGLIIERDNNEGDDGREKSAAFKRIYLVDLARTDENGVLEKIAYIDLMDIQDPEALAPRGSKDGVFTFPFVTIEDVDLVDATTIVVANDNNYPGSTGREAGRADDNEYILLDVADFLKAE
ncbi:esterase-like activity of phytase family protein [Devosia sp.]|uniref:esterase-like activity of phytase family protein n=1 Tax=Devosia sp. TaxID=1871048 RepID=UPI001B2B6324|nr:esterase-like activity of phytase family protein [Devosia sp.]MBO9590466.1 esterase-like activity of phytase family protein [Devosia sp.]